MASGPDMDEHHPLQDGPALVIFRYERLNRKTDSIRVLEVLPRQDDGILRCRMRHVPISETAYRCLSYTWLPTSPTHWIEINGCAMAIGHNLYLFLHAYSTLQTEQLQTSSELPIWIDAISIDQSNTGERNQQVQRMGTIYKNASQVLIWLGELDEELLWFLGEVHAMVESQIIDSALSGPGGVNNWRQNQLKWRVAERWGKHTDFKGLFLGQFARFRALPYWTRVWVAQEILLPNHVVIFFEKRMIEIVTLRDAITTLLRAIGAPLNTEHGFSSFKDNMFMTYGDCRKPRDREHRVTFPTGLPALLAVFQACDCHDIRDRVYAMLSLARNRPPIAVNYDHDSVSLFQKVLLQYMDGSALDQLLWLGTLLIQALELRPPSDHTTPLRNNRLASAVNIGMPTWVDVTLEVIEASGRESDGRYRCSRVVMQCMYVPIYDGNNTHVLEFATTPSDSGPGLVVEFARCHEFLRGTSRELADADTVDCFWLSMPSEDVYYIDTGSIARRVSPARLLRSWKGQDVEQVFHLPADNGLPEEPCLAPSKRYWVQEDVSRFHVIASEMFEPAYKATIQKLEDDKQHENRSESSETRGTLVRWSNIEE